MGVIKTHFKKLVCMTQKSETSMQMAYIFQTKNKSQSLYSITSYTILWGITMDYFMQNSAMVHTTNLWITAWEQGLSNWLIKKHIVASYFSRSELVWLLFVLYVRLYFQKVQDILRRRGKNFRTLLQIREIELKVPDALNSWWTQVSYVVMLAWHKPCSGVQYEILKSQKKVPWIQPLHLALIC